MQIQLADRFERRRCWPGFDLVFMLCVQWSQSLAGAFSNVDRFNRAKRAAQLGAKGHPKASRTTFFAKSLRALKIDHDAMLCFLFAKQTVYNAQFAEQLMQ